MEQELPILPLTVPVQLCPLAQEIREGHQVEAQESGVVFVVEGVFLKHQKLHCLGVRFLATVAQSHFS